MTVTGRQLEELREKLGLSIKDWSRVTALSIATVYRYRTAPDRTCKRDRAGQVHELLTQAGEKEGFEVVGDIVRRALLVRGSLYAYYQVLDIVYREMVHASTT